MDSHRSFVRTIQRLLAAGSLLALLAPVSAEADPPPALAAERRSGPPAPREPPAFAFEACADKQEGASCSVALPDRVLEGSCLVAPDDRLFCMPDNMPPPPPSPGAGPGPTL